MQKSKVYERTYFPVEVLDRAVKFVEAVRGPKALRWYRSVRTDVARWNHDTLEEFYADYRQDPAVASLQCQSGYDVGVNLELVHGNTTVSIEAPSRSQIEELFRIFEDAAPGSRLPEPPEPPTPSPTPPIVFIGHGRSPLWRDLKDHLHEKHGYEVEAYEIGARAGHAIRNVLDGMLRRSACAFLVMTAEDEHVDGTRHARENVIHELGLFQGHLGFSRGIVLLEEGATEFSNIHGTDQIRFSRGNIKETFGEVLATLRREFDRRSKSVKA